MKGRKKKARTATTTERMAMMLAPVAARATISVSALRMKRVCKRIVGSLRALLIRTI